MKLLMRSASPEAVRQRGKVTQEHQAHTDDASRRLDAAQRTRKIKEHTHELSYREKESR